MPRHQPSNRSTANSWRGSWRWWCDFGPRNSRLEQRVDQYLSGRDDIDSAEGTAWAEEQRDLGARGEYFFAIIQFCFTAIRSG